MVGMTKKIFLIGVFIIAGFGFSYSSQNNFGIGVIIGSPTGISAKYYIKENIGLDCGFGWSLKKNVFRLHSDLLFHNYTLLEKSFDFPFVLYYGGGIKLLFADKDEFGVRIPVGLLYNFEKPTIDIFLEIVPVVKLLPDTGFDLDAALGARYYFGLK